MAIEVIEVLGPELADGRVATAPVSRALAIRRYSCKVVGDRPIRSEWSTNASNRPANVVPESLPWPAPPPSLVTNAASSVSA